MVRLGKGALRYEVSRACALGLFSLLGLGNGCTTNHDALARQPKAGSSSGGSGGASGFAAGGFGNSGSDAQGGRVNPDTEPPGDNVLTIVNGVVDAPSVRLCFARLNEDGVSSDFVGAPLPELAYGASTVLTRIDGLSLVDDVIVPWVIAGELSRVKKLDCQAAVALAQAEEAKVTPAEPNGAGGQGADAVGGAGGGDAGQGEAGAPALNLEMPALRARPVAALPAGTVNIGRSILMALGGCIGGAFYADRVAASACGAGYTPSSPTLQPVVVKLSRSLSLDKVGLQGVHASLATDAVDMRVSGDKGAVALVFASSLSFGAIQPRPADLRFSPFDLGVDNPSYGLQVTGANGSVLYEGAWADVLSGSGLASLTAARTYTAVLLGPDPHLIKKGWWNASAFALVDNDPTRK